MLQTNLIGTLSDGDTKNITFPGPVSQSTTFVLVYKGTIGASNSTALDPIDADIGIAAKDFTVGPDSGCIDCGDCQPLVADDIKFYNHITGETGDLVGTGFSYTGSTDPNLDSPWRPQLLIVVPNRPCVHLTMHVTGESENIGIKSLQDGFWLSGGLSAPYDLDISGETKLMIYDWNGVVGSYTFQITQSQ